MGTARVHGAPGPDPHRDRSTPLLSVGIDIGSTNTKVVLVDSSPSDGPVELSVGTFPTPDSPADLVESTLQAVNEAAASAPSAPLAVGIASMAETGAPLDADGRALSPLIRWNRARTGDAVLDGTAVFDRLGAERFFEATGVQPIAKAPIAVWHALRGEDASLWRHLARWAGVADLIAHALTGEHTTDHTLAGRTGAYLLPDIDAPLPRAFDAALLAGVGLVPSQLARVVPAGDAAGTVTTVAARRCGLPVGTPVYIAGHDHAVGAWGAGVRTPPGTANSVGTTEALVTMLAEADSRELDRRSLQAQGMSLVRTVAGDHEALLAGSTGGGALIARLFGTDPALPPPDEIASWPADGPMVLPYPSGRQTPHPDATARLRVVDRTGRELNRSRLSERERWRATLLGLCMQLRWMDETAGRRTEVGTPLAVLGGVGSDRADWLGLKAAVLGRPVIRVTASQPVATAAALLSAVRAGLVPPEVRLPSARVDRPDVAEASVDALFGTFVRAASRDAPEPALQSAWATSPHSREHSP